MASDLIETEISKGKVMWNRGPEVLLLLVHAYLRMADQSIS